MPKEITFYVFLGEKRDPSEIYANSNLRNLTHINPKTVLCLYVFHLHTQRNHSLRSHWSPPLGKYLPHIALADAMVTDFWPNKLSCGVVKLLSEASVQKAQNGPSTQLIEATSCV